MESEQKQEPKMISVNEENLKTLMGIVFSKLTAEQLEEIGGIFQELRDQSIDQ